MTVDQVDQVDAQMAYAIYKQRFADASDFTVTIVGSFTEEELMPLVLQYLGGLPATGRQEEPRDLGLYPPSEGLERTVYRGKEQKSSVRRYCCGDHDYSDALNTQLAALESMLNRKPIARLREAASGLYRASA